MGLDLALLPFDHEGESFSFSHSVLECERRRDLFCEILELEKAYGRAVPDRFNSFLSRDEKYEESHYGLTLTTPYGDPLRTLTAGGLLAFIAHRDVQDNPKNRAVWAYLAHIDPATRVALYWH